MSGHRCDVLAIVDVVTLLSEHSDASKDADAPTVIDGRHIYVLSPGESHQVAHNDSQIFSGLSVGDELHLRETTLALRAEVSALFIGFFLKDAGIVSPMEPMICDAAVPIPDSGDLLNPNCHQMKDHFWRSEVLAGGKTACIADFVVLGRDESVLGYFRWETSIEIGSGKSEANI
ncbi:AidA/PixA family protein [Paraburkholderia aspalathi]|uniref:AidA/PixA family protein n=1 Tax=Paraburkholderia aspalathi TaxID=1324617 RepID=UPI0038B972DA